MRLTDIGWLTDIGFYEKQIILKFFCHIETAILMFHSLMRKLHAPFS